MKKEYIVHQMIVRRNIVQSSIQRIILRMVNVLDITVFHQKLSVQQTLLVAATTSEEYVNVWIKVKIEEVNLSKFFVELQKLPATLLKKETLAQVFSCEFSEICKNAFSYRTPLVVPSE